MQEEVAIPVTVNLDTWLLGTGCCTKSALDYAIAGSLLFI
jgi:hypothetical protein